MQDVREFSKEVTCPHDGRRKRVYLRAIVYQGHLYQRSNGCDDLRGGSVCKNCIARDCLITDWPDAQEHQLP